MNLFNPLITTREALCVFSFLMYRLSYLFISKTNLGLCPYMGVGYYILILGFEFAIHKYFTLIVIGELENKNFHMCSNNYCFQPS